MIKEVIKADGSVEPFDLEKLSKWAKYASKVGGNWTELAIQTFSRLPERVHSKDIHQTMIDVCYLEENIEHSRVASRLELAQLRKNMERKFGIKPNKESFKTLRSIMLEHGVWDKATIPKYSEQQEILYQELKEVKLESWQIAQWDDKYLLKLDGLSVEIPALAAMGIGLGLHGDTQDALDLASDIVYGRTNLPTPVLNGIRNGDFDGVSCCVISAGDSVESIAVADHIALRMTAKKAGIGIEYTTRSKGSSVKGGSTKHLGKHSIYKALDASVKMFTQITRGGSATVGFNVIDPEVENIALWKSQRVDIEQRLDKLDYSFCFNNAFLEAVVKKQDWYLFDYQDAPLIWKAFYNATVADYTSLVQRHVAKGVPHKKIKALDLIKYLLVIRQETGRLYCFNVSRANNHTPFVDVIKLSNLCVAPETQILTDQGYLTIGDLEGQEVNVWNGKEWSKTTVVKTGNNQKLVTVKTSSNQDLDCTEYHKFYVQTGYTRGAIVEKRAHELKVGDKLIKFELPLIQGNSELERAYTNGFYSGDGCFSGGIQRTYLYHSKQDLLSHIEDVRNVYVDVKQNRTTVTHNGNLKDKFFVPLNGYTVKSRLEWFSGLLDSDGSIARNGTNESLQVVSVHIEFLREIQLMLQTLGVTSKINNHAEEGIRKMPLNDGSGNNGEFHCRESWRLLVSSSGLFKLSQLGLETYRLIWDKRLPQRNAEQFVTVKEVIDSGRYDDTYCFNEPKRHMGMFNGILTGQCQEICLPTKPYIYMEDLYNDTNLRDGETAFCSLGAIVPVNIKSDKEYERVAYTLVKSINKLIDKCPKMTKNHERTMLERRSLGVGITGLAEYLYTQGYDYDGSGESLEFVHDLAEKHAFYCYKASIKLSEETGISVQGIKKDWLPVDTKVSKYANKQDWESVRGKPRMNSVVNAHMPTESSAVASGVLNGLYPARRKVINKKSRKGVVQFICDSFNPNVHLNAYDVPNVTLSKYYGVVQDWSDQGISADTYFRPTDYVDEKKPMTDLLREWVAHFRLGNKSMYYVNTEDTSGGSIHDVLQNLQAVEDEACVSCTL